MPVDSSDRQTDSGLSTFLNLSASQKMLALTWAGKAAISCMDQGQTETLTHTATLYTRLTMSHPLSAQVQAVFIAVSPLPLHREARSPASLGSKPGRNLEKFRLKSL